MLRLMAFLGAGMNAPATKEIQMEVQQ